MHNLNPIGSVSGLKFCVVLLQRPRPPFLYRHFLPTSQGFDFLCNISVMEFVGLAASIAALSELALKVLSGLYKYYGDVKSGPARSAELREELGSILFLFEGPNKTLSYLLKKY